MKKIFSIFMVIAVLVIAGPSFTSALEEKDFINTIELFRKSNAVKGFFKNSYGYAVFPTIGKAGWVVGGSYGEGRVYHDGDVTGKVSVVEGSIGFQFGGKAFSEIIFFEDKRAYEEFTSGEFEFDATVQATAVTAGVEAQAGTGGDSAGATAGPKTDVHADLGYYKGMAVFVHNKGGLMYEVSVSGQKFKFTPIVK